MRVLAKEEVTSRSVLASDSMSNLWKLSGMCSYVCYMCSVAHCDLIMC